MADPRIAVVQDWFERGHESGRLEYSELLAALDLDARASQRNATRARPVVYVSTSEGQITDWEAYAPDGNLILDEDELPVIVVQIDWDDVTREEDPTEEYSATSRAHNWAMDTRLPARLRQDIGSSIEHARRFDDIAD